MIERYGLERYEQHKARMIARCKELYRNDPEFREYMNARCNVRNKARYHNDSEFRESEKARCKARNKDRYHNDSEFREFHKARTSAYSKARYVEDGRIDLIESYELAKADNFEGWDIHHRLEIHDDYINSMKHLKLMNLYYNRPPSELIWLREIDHRRIHAKVRRRN